MLIKDFNWTDIKNKRTPESQVCVVLYIVMLKEAVFIGHQVVLLRQILLPVVPGLLQWGDARMFCKPVI